METDYSETILDQLISYVGSIEDAFPDPELAFVLGLTEHRAHIVAFRLLLSPLKASTEVKFVEAGCFVGFRGPARAVNQDARGVISALLNFKIPCIDRSYVVSAQERFPGKPVVYNKIPGYYQELPNPFYRSWGISGFGGMVGLTAEEVVHSLRSAPKPYYDIKDFLSEFGLDGTDFVEIAALAPIVVDSSSSIENGRVKINLLKSKGVDVREVSLGLNVFHPDRSVERLRIQGGDFNWQLHEDQDSAAVGKVEFDADNIDAIRCFANFQGQCFHTFWVGDPAKFENTRKVIYEIIDGNIARMSQLLRQGTSGGNSEGHEDAVAALLWMLGFAPFRSGNISKDAADIYAIADNGDVLVIECTLGDMKAGRSNKIQKLLDRVEVIRDALRASYAGHLTCIPVMVSGREAGAIADDIDECERKGIMVITVSDLSNIIERAHRQPNSVELVESIKHTVKSNSDKYAAKERQDEQIRKDVGKIKRTLTS